MSSAHGHFIRRFPDAARDYPGGRLYAGHSGGRCAGARDCFEPLAFYASYRYVTGRAGRTTRRDLYLCRKHGEHFAAKHNLKIDEATEPAQ
jgi:hypothetical protein